MFPTTETAPQPVLRSSYRAYPWRVASVHLVFELAPRDTLVTATLELECTESGAPLVLDGEELKLESITVNGEAITSYTIDGDQMTVEGLPDKCTLQTKVRLAPEDNKALSGLYRTSGNYCTQCEAEGFRRITYFPDRPDVMTSYSVELIADPKENPVMLSNGNRVSEEDLPDGRRRVCWEDPHKKPSYLFALVSGDLACKRGSFTTMNGREVALEVWVEHQDADKADHALASLIASMKWDEETFGLEYDLDLYMIVAVGDFNMGAMENKGLNVFNSKFVLARPDTATDGDYESIEGVIGHEYFHNWTGNRVTCRDWFQLTLKEGLTVYRDQRFTADQTSAPVTRISNVAMLRARQLPEDAGPMAHPIRPESYVAMDNFYTATVYEKGSEVVRMYETLLGREGFRKGMDLYFERHDGQAVTCDDFRAAMADANGVNLDQFERWYLQAGTPKLSARGEWNEAAGTYSLTLRQGCPTGQDESAFSAMLVPVRMGLIGPDGADMPLAMEGAEGAPTQRVLELTELEQTFVFTGITARPIPSLLRDYSAPVVLDLPRTDEELAFLLGNDSDLFNRWDAGQELFAGQIFAAAESGSTEFPAVVIDAFRQVLTDAALDGSIRARLLSLPDERDLAQRMEPVNPDTLRAARTALAEAIAKACESELRSVYQATAPSGAYQATKAEIDRRATHSMTLGYLSLLGATEAAAQFDAADNMTDAQAALSCLCSIDGPERERALAEFHAKWKEEPLVLDKWFTAQAASELPGTPARVRELMSHPDFTLENPNRARSLIGAFTMLNHGGFHDASGEGYQILADAVLEIDGRNPQLAARLVGSFNPWKRYDEARGALMKAQLERIQGTEGLSKNTGEIVGRALEG